MPVAPLRPDWMPTAHTGTRTLPCGRWWDGVRVSSYDGKRAIGSIRERTGPVIEDQASGIMMWLVPVGGTDGWLVDGVTLTVLGRGRWVDVPPADRRDTALRWLVPPPVGGDCLTDPRLLYGALRSVLDIRARRSGR